jgi:hypothetical protein
MHMGGRHQPAPDPLVGAVFGDSVVVAEELPAMQVRAQY